jgi:HK97 family phage portal protein
MAAEEFSARFFGNGSHLGGLVTAEGEVTPEQAQEAKKHWRENTAGLAKAHEVAVLQKGFKYQALGIPPRDAQLIESRQFSVQEIARLFGVANWMLNEAAGSTSWGSGLAEQTKGLLTFTLQSWLSRIEDRLTAELMPPDSYVEFTRAGLLHTTTKERYDSYHVAILAGFMTPNECRALENLPSLQEPDADLLAAPKARPRAT